MSLGKIGKLTNVFNAFKQSPFSNKSDMISSLAAFGNINKAASYLNKVNSDGAISNTASKMLLYKAYAASGITKEEAGEALNNNLAGSSKFGLLGNIKNVGSGIATVFKSIAPMMIPLIIGAVGIKAGKMLWDNVLTDNAAQKNLQESVQKYKTEKSDLDNLQSQKETNKQRVYELRAKSNRTAAEDNELNNLLNEDSILDTQIGLKKRTVTSAQKQQALDAKKALEKRTFQGELFGKPNKAGDLEEYSFRYGHIISLNTHMTQKAHHRIDDLEKSLTTALSTIETLKQEIETLKQAIA